MRRIGLPELHSSAAQLHRHFLDVLARVHAVVSGHGLFFLVLHRHGPTFLHGLQHVGFKVKPTQLLTQRHAGNQVAHRLELVIVSLGRDGCSGKHIQIATGSRKGHIEQVQAVNAPTIMFQCVVVPVDGVLHHLSGLNRQQRHPVVRSPHRPAPDEIGGCTVHIGFDVPIAKRYKHRMGFQALGLVNGHQRNAVGIAGRCNGLL